MLKGKHPEPKDAAEKAFLHCDELPPMADVDVTAAHIEKVAGGRGGRGAGVVLWQCIAGFSAEHTVRG